MSPGQQHSAAPQRYHVTSRADCRPILPDITLTIASGLNIQHCLVLPFSSDDPYFKSRSWSAFRITRLIGRKIWTHHQHSNVRWSLNESEPHLSLLARHWGMMTRWGSGCTGRARGGVQGFQSRLFKWTILDKSPSPWSRCGDIYAPTWVRSKSRLHVVESVLRIFHPNIRQTNITKQIPRLLFISLPCKHALILR